MATLSHRHRQPAGGPQPPCCRRILFGGFGCGLLLILTKLSYLIYPLLNETRGGGGATASGKTVKTAIDSSVLLAIFNAEADARSWLRLLIEARRECRLLICDVVYAEIART